MSFNDWPRWEGLRGFYGKQMNRWAMQAVKHTHKCATVAREDSRNAYNAASTNNTCCTYLFHNWRQGHSFMTTSSIKNSVVNSLNLLLPTSSLPSSSYKTATSSDCSPSLTKSREHQNQRKETHYTLLLAHCHMIWKHSSIPTCTHTNHHNHVRHSAQPTTPAMFSLSQMGTVIYSV